MGRDVLLRHTRVGTQFNDIPGSKQPLEHSPKILEVIMDPSLSFHKHCNYVIGSTKETYAKGTVGIIMETGQGDVTADLQRIGEIYQSYVAPVWSTNTND